MGETIGYHSPAVYLPQATNLANLLPQQPTRDRSEGIGGPTGVETDRVSDLPSGARVESVADVAEDFDKADLSRDDPQAEQTFDRGSAVLAQELADTVDQAGSVLDDLKRIAAVASPAEMVGTKDALTRLDQDRDGHIDQMEVQQALRARDEQTTYAALSFYRKTVGMTEGHGEAAAPKKMFDGDEKMFDDPQAAKLYDKVAEKKGEPAAETGAGKKLFDGEAPEADKVVGETGAEEGEGEAKGDDGVEIIV